MKSLTAVCQTGASMPAINPNGRAITRHQHPQRENAEMKMYLSKLKDLVPFMPKNRKLSKLEIIQHVIDYICDLQSELETHPDIGNFDAASALNFAASQNIPMDDDDDEDADDELQEDGGNGEDALSQRLAAEAQQQMQSQQYHSQQSQQQQQQAQSSSSPAIQRQPLVDRQAPNTILPVSTSIAVAAFNGVQQLQQQQQLHHHQQQQQQQQVVLQNSQTTSAEKDSNSRQTSC